MPPEQRDPNAPWDGSYDRRRPTTAELAVPWLIGVILLLVGVVILLIVLLMAGEDALSGRDALDKPPDTPTPRPSPTARAVGGPVESPIAPAPTPPQLGAMELAFLARAEPLAPIGLMRDDFATDGSPAAVTTSMDGVERHDWALDGSVGVVLGGGRAVAIDPGQEPRPLADGLAAVAFGADRTTVYAVRITDDSGNETATVVAIDFVSGQERTITQVTYPDPVLTFASRVQEAQFADEGGPVRLYWLTDGRLALSVPGGASVAIGANDGSQTALAGQPLLWSPDASLRVEVTDQGNGTTALVVLDQAGAVRAAAYVTGAVSHLRWSPAGDQVIFTLGVPTPDGGVRQDLQLWVFDRSTPIALTTNGATFAAEWLGARETWQP